MRHFAMPFNKRMKKLPMYCLNTAYEPFPRNTVGGEEKKGKVQKKVNSLTRFRKVSFLFNLKLSS